MSSHRRSMWRRRVLVLVAVLVVGGFALSSWLLRPHHARVPTATQAPPTPDALAGEHRVAAGSEPRVEPPTVHKAGETPAHRRVNVRADAAPRRVVTASPAARRTPSTGTQHHTRAAHHQKKKARPRHPTKTTAPVRHVTPTRHHEHHGDQVRNFLTSLLNHQHHGTDGHQSHHHHGTVRHQSHHHVSHHHSSFHTTGHHGHGWGNRGHGHHRQRSHHWRHPRH